MRSQFQASVPKGSQLPIATMSEDPTSFLASIGPPLVKSPLPPTNSMNCCVRSKQEPLGPFQIQSTLSYNSDTLPSSQLSAFELCIVPGVTTPNFPSLKAPNLGVFQSSHKGVFSNNLKHICRYWLSIWRDRNATYPEGKSLVCLRGNTWVWLWRSYLD